MRRIAQTSCGKGVDDLKDSGLGTDIDAHGGGVQDQHTRICREPFRKHDPLLIASGELLDGPVSCVGLDAQFLENPTVDGLGALCAINKAQSAR